MTFMKSVALSGASDAALADVFPANKNAPPAGMVVLTLSGDVRHPTRGPADDTPRSLLSTLGLTFDKAAEFDADDLAAFEQYSLKTTILTGQLAGTFTGPLLSAVLKSAGLPRADVTATGIDGYQIHIPAGMIARHEPIIATHLNGHRLDIGGFGPLAVAFPQVDDPAAARTLRGMQAWAIIHLAAAAPRQN